MNQKQLKQIARDLKQSLVASALGDMQYAKERAKEVRSADYTLCAKALAIVQDNGYKPKSHYISGTDKKQITIRILVPSLKEPALLDVLSQLEDLTVSECVSKPYANEWCQEMTFRFGDYTSLLSVNLECDIPSDSLTCRKVLIGEKLEVVKKYELQCD